MLDINFDLLNKTVREVNTHYIEGTVKEVIGLTIEVKGIRAFVGELCTIYNQEGKAIKCEVVGFREDAVLLMPLGELIGISAGCRVVPERRPLEVNCSEALLGKVLDGLGNPLTDEELLLGEPYPLENEPPDPLKRKRITDILPTGVRAIDGFLTVGEG